PTAQHGWFAGPVIMLLFSAVTYYTSCLLADCYRSGDPVTGKKLHLHGCRRIMSVRMSVFRQSVKICSGWDINLFGVAIGYTIAASISMTAIKRSNCFHASHDKDPCEISSIPYMIIFGVTAIIFSQIPDFDQIG
ncbi:Amino acid permease 3-like protein, partial [Drosera capensis]